MLKKFAVRFLLVGETRTYVLTDVHTIDAICTALDLLEIDRPNLPPGTGLAVICKAWPAADYLINDGQGVVIDTTRPAIVPVLAESVEAAAA